MKMKIQTILTAAALGLATLMTSGCGSSAPAAASDPNQARTVLHDVLESWKRGDPSDAPTKLNPVVYVSDEDWIAGAKLQDYTIEPGDQAFGTSVRCPVSLKIQPKVGKTTTRRVLYVVTTAPVLRVDRQD